MNATVSWIANTETDLAGYLVYHGIASLIYDPGITVLVPTTTYMFVGLDVGLIHYFNVKAFDTSGNVSAFGGEVTKFEPFPIYPLVLRQHITPHRRAQAWKTDTGDQISGFIAEALGLNIIPPPPPPPETFPIYEAIGGFMIV